MTTEQKYTFGDTDRAASRLERLAELYRPALVDFLTRAGYGPGGARTRAVERAFDLGSGPGHTSRTLAELLAGAKVVGLERSTRFVELAEREEARSVSFVAHDVTQLPFPAPPADLAYSRFLLTHLREPSRVLSQWARTLRPGARILLQETAELSSQDATLGEYYGLVARLQAHYGQELHIGRRLEELVDGRVFRVVDFRVNDLPLSAARLAELHRMNLETWRRDPFAQAAFDAERLDALAIELADVALGRRSAHVRHALGELVLEVRAQA